MSRGESLLDLLDARAGIVCAVGAGGKKSLLQHLAKGHPGRVALTGTVVTPHFPPSLGFDVAIAPPGDLPAAVARLDPSTGAAYACPHERDDRHSGVAPGLIERIHHEQGFAATYVKADGARMRWIKAPAPDEPIFVPGTDLVIPVVSARAIGEPLGERVAHRVDRVAAVTGVAPGEVLTPEAVGRLLASEQGALYRAAGGRVAPVINMVDNDDKEELARAAATAAIAMTSRFDRVVLCCMRRPERPVVAVVTG
jgi:probable selenium-dependent hydroxylase accessory protein YqeC